MDYTYAYVRFKNHQFRKKSKSCPIMHVDSDLVRKVRNCLTLLPLVRKYHKSAFSPFTLVSKKKLAPFRPKEE